MHKQTTETIVHHSMAVTGGVFGVYALFMRDTTFGSSETSNLIYLVVSGLTGSVPEFVIRVGALLCYASGIMFANLVPKLTSCPDIKLLSIIVDAVAVFVLAAFSEDMHPVLALYPMFFATALQWSAFMNAAGYASATIFSTNNIRQFFIAVSDYMHDRNRTHLRKAGFYAGTLIFFHIGVVFGWFALAAWRIKSIYICIPCLLFSLIALMIDSRNK